MRVNLNQMLHEASKTGFSARTIKPQRQNLGKDTVRGSFYYYKEMIYTNHITDVHTRINNKAIIDALKTY